MDIFEIIEIAVSTVGICYVVYNRIQYSTEKFKKFKKPKVDKFKDYYKKKDEKVYSYEVGFCLRENTTWYYKKITRKEIEYTYFNSITSDVGTMIYGKDNPIKLLLDDFLSQYLKYGKIAINNHPTIRLKRIGSDLYIREEYKSQVIKITFELFDRIHKPQKKENISAQKILIVETFRYFGFNKVPTKKELRISYLNLAKTYHPDSGGSDEQMRDLNLKYELVKSHAK